MLSLLATANIIMAHINPGMVTHSGAPLDPHVKLVLDNTGKPLPCLSLDKEGGKPGLWSVYTKQTASWGHYYGELLCSTTFSGKRLTAQDKISKNQTIRFDKLETGLYEQIVNINLASFGVELEDY